jgi:C-terminal processing protease CtpA/Prc
LFRKGRAVILTTFGSPAEEAGLLSRDSILEVNGEPILDGAGFIRDIVRGPEGSSMDLTAQTPGQGPRQVTLNRRRISGPTPVPYRLLTTSRKRRSVYFGGDAQRRTIGDQVGQAIQISAKPGRTDSRQPAEHRGADTTTQRVGPIYAGTLGAFVSRSGERPLVVDGSDVDGSQDLPLTVLVGPGTVSYGEVLSGVLHDIGRAYLIGETSEGNVESLWGYDFEDGSRAWLAQESFRPLNNPGQNWEQTGIVPDLVVPFEWDEDTLDTDPVVISSLEFFDDLE